MNPVEADQLLSLMRTIAFLLILKAAVSKYERWEENIHISILTMFCVLLLFLFEEFCCSGVNLITLITRKCYPVGLYLMWILRYLVYISIVQKTCGNQKGIK